MSESENDQTNGGLYVCPNENPHPPHILYASGPAGLDFWRCGGRIQ